MMKRINAILLTAFLLTVVNAGYAGTVAAPYEVGRWSGFRTAAITYTFDDDCPHQLSTAVPMFNGYGFKMTMFTVTSSSWAWPPNWTGLQNAAAQGHEIGNHTVTHPSNWCSLSASAQASEYASSQNTINFYIPGNQCLTVAYPYCCYTNPSTVATYFIAGRTCSGVINSYSPSDFYQISSFILGSSGINTTAGITQKDDQAASQGGWVVYLIHGIDTEPGAYSPILSTILNESLQYLDTHRSTFWVNTFLNVVKYIKERNDVSVSETSNTGDSITLSVTDTLSNTIYNYPITIRRPLPAGWTGAIVKQNDVDVNASIVTVGPTQYVMFDVVPDGGSVVLYKIPFLVPSGLIAMPEASDILLNWDDINDSHVAGYNVYRSFMSGALYSKLNNSPLTDSNYTDTDVFYGTPLYYVVTSVDTNGTESEYSNEVSALPRIAAGVGAVLREWWTGIEGNDVSLLTSDANYPGNPAGKSLLPSLSGPVNWQDNYGTRIRGYVYPPADGDYLFWISSDANSELWLSANADSANAVRIASVPDYTDVQQWNKYAEQQSSVITLATGKKYYIEVLHKAGLGNDHVEVAWQGPDIGQQVIDGLSLSPCCLEFKVFSSFATQWGQSGCSEENNWCGGSDLNRNGVIDLGDLREFTAEWLDGL